MNLEKRNFNLKKYSQNPFWGHYLCTIDGFDESIHNTKKTDSSLDVSVQNFVKFRSVVFEILMKICFDSSISIKGP